MSSRRLRRIVVACLALAACATTLSRQERPPAPHTAVNRPAAAPAAISLLPTSLAEAAGQTRPAPRRGGRALGTIYTVSTTADVISGSLRDCINQANANSGVDTIQFAIPASGVQVLTLSSPLPAITEGVVIDGYSQTGSSVNAQSVGDDAVLQIQLDGGGISGAADGLAVTADTVTIQGLAITHFNGNAITATSSAACNVLGCFLGMTPSGSPAANVSAVQANDCTGLRLGSAAPADRNVIGNTSAAAVRIGGSSGSDNQVVGNYIGFGPDGLTTAAVATSGVVVQAGTVSQIRGNYIGNCTSHGLELNGATVTGAIVSTNSIGRAVNDYTLAPCGVGIYINGAQNNTIGGTATTDANVVMGSTGDNIELISCTGNVVGFNSVGTTASGVPGRGRGRAAGAGGGADGIVLTNAGSNDVLSNLVSDHVGNGIRLTGSNTGACNVKGNLVGVDATGTIAVPNGGDGIVVEQNAHDCLVGGTTATDRNLVSGNTGAGIHLTTAATVTTLAGNYIGTSVDGLADLGNSGSGVVLDSVTNTVVGGTAAGSRNLISGNTLNGVAVQGTGSGNLIQGNWIGLDANGNTSLKNDLYGVAIAAPGCTVGGTTAAARNAIGGNGTGGVAVTGGSTTIQGNYIGTHANGTTAVGNSGPGIQINTSGNTIGGAAAGAGNVISGNTGAGILLSGAFSGNVVQGNTIGLSALGDTAVPNATGIVLTAGINGSDIGGTTAGSGNIISGNTGLGVNVTGSTTSGNRLRGNTIGLNAAGTAALANGAEGIFVSGAPNTVIGINTATAGTQGGNVISGNGGNGIKVDLSSATGVDIKGNLIGLNAAGTAALGNSGDGIATGTAPAMVVGGTTTGDGNVVSGNAGNGIVVRGGSTVAGNLVGTNRAGTAVLGNGTGASGFSGIATQGAGCTIGGTTVAARNVVVGSHGAGITCGANTAVQGNYVGVGPTGTVAMGNLGAGVVPQGGSTIGGSTATPGTPPGNVIAANQKQGILCSSTTGTITVLGNVVGDSSGATALGNVLSGIEIYRSAAVAIGSETAGDGNLIAGNHEYGVRIGDDGTALRNRVSGNRVFGNTGEGIALYDSGFPHANDAGDADAGPNNLQNTPTLLGAQVISGQTRIAAALDSLPANTAYPVTLEAYANNQAATATRHEGMGYLGSATLATNGSVTFNTAAATVGQYVTLLAIDANGNTSQFSADQPAAGTPAKLLYSNSPSSAVAAQVISPPVTVRVTDSGGRLCYFATNPVTLTASAGPAGRVLSGTTTVNAVNGVATFSNLSLNKAGSGYVLTATSAGLTSADSTAFTVTTGAASSLSFSVQPTTTAVATLLTPAVKVSAVDSGGNVITSFGGTIALSLSGGASGAVLGGNVNRVAAAGVATFDNLTVDQVGTVYRLQATSTGVGSATSAPFDITPGAPHHLTYKVPPSNATAGSPITPGVQVEVDDSRGNLVTTSTAAITVSLSTSPSGDVLTGTLTKNASGGVALFDTLTLVRASGGYVLRASSSGLVAADSAPFSVSPAVPDHLAVTAAVPAATAGAPVTPPIAVEVRDAFENRVTTSAASITASLATNPTGTTLLGTLTRTASGGTASFADLSIQLAANGYGLKFASSGLTGVASNLFNVAPAAADHLAFVQQPTNTAQGQPIAPAVSVQALDSFGNLATSYAGNVTMALANNPNGAALGGTLARPVTSGVATFSNLTLNRSGSGYTLQATSGGLTAATSAGFDSVATTVTQLAFSVQPSNVQAGATMVPAVVVQLLDASSNLVTTATNSVHLTVTGAPGTVLLGTTTRNASGGQASFNNLSLTAPGTYTLTASVSGAASAVSQSFTVTSSSAAAVAFSVQPSTTTAGQPITPSVQVRVIDTFGNATNSNATVTVALLSGGPSGVLLGTRQVAAVNGVATFPGLHINQSGAGFRLTASGVGLNGGASATFDIVAGAATHLALVTPPSDGTAGLPLSPAPEVELRDAFENPVVAANAPITVKSTDPTAPAVPPVTTVNGRASFGNVVLRQAGSHRLTFSSSGLTSVTSAPFTIAAGAPAVLAFGQGASDVVAGANIRPAVTVRIEDAEGNLVSGATNSVTVALPGYTLNGTTTVSAVNGVATFSQISVPLVGIYRLAASATGLTTANGTNFHVTPATPDASRSDLSVSPASAVADSSQTLLVTVTARDAFGNPIIGLAASHVVLDLTPSGGSVTQPSSATDASGQTQGSLRASKPGIYSVGARLAGVTLLTRRDAVFTPRLVDPAHSSQTLMPARIAADGTQVATLHVVLRDSANVPVEGQPATARSLEILPVGSSGITVQSLGLDTGPDGALDVKVTASTAGVYQLALHVGAIALPLVTLTARGSYHLQLAAGIHFVGIPLVVDADSQSALLAAPGVHAVFWDAAAQNYRPWTAPFPTGLVPGLWLKLDTPLDLTLRGNPITTDPLSVPLARGWNALPNPFTSPLPWRLSQVQVFVGGVARGTLADTSLWGTVVNPYAWRYDAALGVYRLVFDPTVPGFESVDSQVPPGEAVWVESLVGGVELRLPQSLGAGSGSPSTRSHRDVTVGPRDWQARLQLTAGGQTDATNWVGQSSHLARALVLDDPPPAGTAPRVRLEVVAGPGRAAAGDIRPWRATAESWDLLATVPNGSPASLAWPSLQRDLPRGLLLELRDLTTGRAVLLNASAGYTWQPQAAGESRRFRLTAQTGHVQRAEVAGMTVVPTRGRGLAVTLQLTAPADVVVTVRGLGGRVVKQLSPGRAETGLVTVSWDGTDTNGRAVPQGMYLVEAVVTSENGAGSRAGRSVMVR